MSDGLPPTVSDDALCELLEIVAGTPQGSIQALTHPGLALASRHGYTAESLLGEGGMSQVWRGIDANTGRDVAIKVAKPGIASGHALLVREAEVLRRFHDPGIVGLIRQGGTTPQPARDPSIVSARDSQASAAGDTPDIRQDPGPEYVCDRYLVLEFVEGQTLEELLSGCNANLSTLVNLLVDLCDVVHKVHAAGLIHNDLKPANVMVQPNGTVVLLDFALCAPPGDRSNAFANQQVRGGTDHFLAPELTKGARHHGEVATDVYALGATLRWVVESHQDEIPARLEQVVMHACHQEPAQRTASARLLGAALKDAATPIKRSQHWKVYSIVPIVLFISAILWLVQQEYLSSTESFAPGNPPPPPAVASTAPPLQEIAHILIEGNREEAAAQLQAIHDGREGWEWRHLWANATKPPAVLTTQFTSPGTATALNSVGDSLLLGGRDGAVHRIDAQSGLSTLLFKQSSPIGHLDLQPGGRFLAVDHAGHLISGTDDEIKRRQQVTGSKLTVCWSSETHDYAWASSSSQIYRIGRGDGDIQIEPQTTEMVVPSASSSGWRLQATPTPAIANERTQDAAGVHAPQENAPDGAKPRTFTLRNPHGVVQRSFEFTARELPLSFDVEPASGRVAIGTSLGRVWLTENLLAAPSYLPMPSNYPVCGVALAGPEDRLFVAAKSIHIFSLNEGKRLLSLPIDQPGFSRYIRWHPPTGTLTVVSDQAFTQWNAPPPPASDTEQMVLR